MNPLAGKWLAVSYLRKILGSKSAEDYYDVVGGQCVGDQRPTPLLVIPRAQPEGISCLSAKGWLLKIQPSGKISTKH